MIEFLRLFKMFHFLLSHSLAAGLLSTKVPIFLFQGFSLQTPLVYHHGVNNPMANVRLYTTLVQKISEVVHKRFDQKEKGKSL